MQTMMAMITVQIAVVMLTKVEFWITAGKDEPLCNFCTVRSNSELEALRFIFSARTERVHLVTYAALS